MKKHKWYFTHQTVDRKSGRSKELFIEMATGLELENPFYDGEAKEVANLDAGLPITITPDEIVGMDLRKIREANGIVALMTSPSDIGSCMEIAIGAFAWGKPVYVIAEYDGAYNHPWIVHFATKRFHSVEEFITYAKQEISRG